MLRIIERAGGRDQDFLGIASPKCAGSTERAFVDDRDAPAALPLPTTAASNILSMAHFFPSLVRCSTMNFGAPTRGWVMEAA